MNTIEVNETKQYLVINESDDILEVTNYDIGLIEVGTQGPSGVNGTNGLDGDKHFEYSLVGQTDITILHNLSKYPAISVFDSAGDEVEGDYQHLDINTSRLIFSAGFSGKAIFN